MSAAENGNLWFTLVDDPAREIFPVTLSNFWQQEMPILESDRLRALRDLELLDTPPSESFDRVTRLASQLFNTPIAAVSLTDENRQWFKSRVGCGPEIPRDKAPCAEVTRTRSVVVVPDLSQDCRFAGGYLVENGVRFYAGAPLTTREGYTLGSMCVLDTQPRPTATPEDAGGLKDLAAMVMAQIELQHSIGRIDPSSGLPNRNQFVEDVEDMSLDNKGAPRTGVLIDLADPARLSQAVRVLGPGCLDNLIHSSLTALKDVLGPVPLYHVGATQFIAIFEASSTAEPAKHLVGKLRRLRRIAAEWGAALSDICFGVVMFRLGDVDPGDLIRAAHGAAQDARQTGSGVGLYCPSIDAAHLRRFEIMTGLRKALSSSGQLRLVYQPTVSLETGLCDGVEALLRWRHPTLGNIAPSEFIPLAEQTDLAKPLTEWVVERVLSQLAQWRASGISLRASVNVSASNLEDPSFAHFLISALKRHGIPASALKVEFTEGMLIGNRSRVLKNLQKMRATGIVSAIDDFGTGYSSFAYLRDIPADTVKIDRSFIMGIAQGTRNGALVHNMINMMRELDLRVVAEGVETREVYDFLRDARCNSAQGYFIARPLDPGALQAWLRRGGAPARAERIA